MTNENEKTGMNEISEADQEQVNGGLRNLFMRNYHKWKPEKTQDTDNRQTEDQTDNEADGEW